MLLTHALLSGCTSYLVTILVTMQRCNFGYCYLNQVACVRTTSLSVISTTCYQVLITSIMLLPVVMCIRWSISIYMVYHYLVLDHSPSNQWMYLYPSLYLLLVITIALLDQGCYRPPVTPHTGMNCALGIRSHYALHSDHLSTNQFPCCSYYINTHALILLRDRDRSLTI